MSIDTASKLYGPRSDRARIAGLLKRYPQISGAESGEIVIFIKTARHLDIGLLTADPEVRSLLDSFMQDHKRHFEARVPESAMIAAAVVGAIIVVALLELAFG